MSQTVFSWNFVVNLAGYRIIRKFAHPVRYKRFSGETDFWFTEKINTALESQVLHTTFPLVPKNKTYKMWIMLQSCKHKVNVVLI